MTHSNTNLRSGQYLTHAHSHIIQVVAAMHSCFGLARPHQYKELVHPPRQERAELYMGLFSERRPCYADEA